MKDTEKALIFVYNADSGLLNAINDGILKIVSPSTYQCRLCSLTFGVVQMKSRWKQFIESLNVPAEFLHRDEFNERYGLPDAEFPSVYIRRGDEMSVLISKEEMENTDSLEGLMEMLKTKLDMNGKNT
ncbi:MAG: hypothetical protein JSV18_06690 [Candidatus Bathyarchaeota archaeon]|nr:MAG: hypothetical protein JSV18_06690 [Candidatus Bathyarchaeota archaeon]